MAKQGWDEAARALAAAETVAVCCHVAPDGDALGSMLGLGGFLMRQGKTVHMSWGSPTTKAPPQYGFMPGLDQVIASAEVPDVLDVFVAIDCGDNSRLESLKDRFDSAKTTINIDHHISNDSFADINIVDPDRASSCELAFELIKRMDGDVEAQEALCLYTGIVTDTGRFQYSNASPATLRAAAELRDLGLDHEKVSAEIYESNSFAYLRVLGIVLSRASLEEGFVWSWVDQADLSGVDLDETEHFIDALRAVREARVAAILKQQPEGGYKVSLRSKGDVDVAAIAKGLGGGGHARAAGYSSTAPIHSVIATLKSRIAKA
ncbi:MAG: bifunctional oligoribonuclease/PAP phosphatase NrnA [Actinomycetota bacterium]